jgi:SAM-dependent methyltransferase
VSEDPNEKLAKAATELPAIYSDALHYDVLAQMTAPNDLPFYRALVAEHGGPILELGCGTGRVALALAKDGEDVFGIDLAPAMLELLKQKADLDHIAMTVALGDLRSFTLGRTFPLVLFTYNTINHMLELDSLTRALASARRHMDEGSRLVIDTFQPSLAFLGADPERRRQILRYLDPYTREETRLFEENHYDAATQKNRVTWIYTTEARGEVQTRDMTMRLYFPAELDALLTLSGFTIEAKYGDYDRRPFDKTSSKQLIVARAAP